MNKIRIYLISLLCVFSVSVSAQNMQKLPELYIYAVGLSLKDTTAYMSSIVELDSAWVNKKNGFLYARNEYSYQFADYLKSLQIENPIVSVSYTMKYKDADKKYGKTANKLRRENYLLRSVSDVNFKFKAVEYTEPDEVVEEKAENSKKADKNNKKDKSSKEKKSKGKK